MKKEERKLLIKDLTARISYGVICKLDGIKDTNLLTKVEFNNTGDAEFSFLWKISIKGHRNEYVCSVEDFKPYLRPMSSMTEEEKDEFYNNCSGNVDNRTDYKGLFFRNNFVPFEDINYAIDWLNAHHFDYRGLIEKGLAIKAPKGMYT